MSRPYYTPYLYWRQNTLDALFRANPGARGQLGLMRRVETQTGIDYTLLSRYRNHERRVPDLHATLIAVAAGVPFDDLFSDPVANEHAPSFGPHESERLHPSHDALAFWQVVDRGDPDACWPWRGPWNRKTGYGMCGTVAAKSGNHGPGYAHRRAYLLAHGPIPAGQYVLHHCDNRICCNPAHLYAGTAADHARDRDTRGRNGTRRLSEDQAREILALRWAIPGTAVAERYGVSFRAVYAIWHRQTWRCLDWPVAA